MSLKCTIGVHDWDGCRCLLCGKTRDEGHDWSKDCGRCARCGKTRMHPHDWEGCRCRMCEATRDEGHDWSKDCEACTRCGKTREASHDWSADCGCCARCGRTREDAHQWDGCTCSVCGKVRDEGHDWSYDCQKCAICGRTREDAHRWDGCTCLVCGKVRDEGHDWSADCGCCARCGRTREDGHRWDGCTCPVCGKVVHHGDGCMCSACGAGKDFIIAERGIEMVWIPPCEFTLGSETGDDADRPVTRVTLSKGYWLGKHRLTQAQWRAMMNIPPPRFQYGDPPVENVSWEDAMEFCWRLTQQEAKAGRLPEGYQYTLPAEAEWEHAFHEVNTGEAPAACDSTVPYAGNASGAPPPRRKAPAAFEVHGMYSTVWEWCWDWHAAYPGGAVTDPAGPGSGTHRVYRGGGWSTAGGLRRSVYRGRLEPDVRFILLSFRVALSAIPRPE